MRHFKATLLLGTLTAGLVFFFLLGGWFAPLENIWKGFFTGEVGLQPLPDFIEALFILFFAFAVAAIGIAVTTQGERFLLVLFSGFLVLSGSGIGGLYHFFINPFPLEMALVLSYLMVLLFIRTASGSRQPLLRHLFGKRIHRQIFQKMLDGEMPLDFLGELKNGTVLICALNNHSELMEALKPEDYVKMTNLYLQTASDFLVDVGGYIEECSGESVRAIFGVPLPVEATTSHAVKAVRAALDLAIRLDELNRTCDARWQKRLDFRIGISSGEMIPAIYGGTRLRQYSVAGPVVDFARYLCAACINYGCRILVAPSTYEMTESTMEFRPIDLLQRKGLRRRVELYEVLAPKNTLSIERERSRDLFWQGVIFFRSQEWDKAVAAFTAARILGIPDKVLDLYLERIDRARRGVQGLSPEEAVLTELL